MNRFRNVLSAFIAGALIATLAFLYDKTQAVDLRERNDIAALLGTLREIDNRWDIDVLRERSELDPNRPSPPNRSETAKRTLASLAAVVPHAGSAALSEGLGPLNKAVLEKADLVEKYAPESLRAKIALHAVISGRAALGAQADAPRSVDARQRNLDQTLGQLVAATEKYYWRGEAAAPAGLQRQASDVVELAAGVSDAARERAAAVSGAIQELLAHKPVEEALFVKISSLSSGPRLDRITFAFDRELEATLQEKERFRVYLLAYAAALLLGAGYLGIRLRAANEGLQQHLSERTRGLDNATRHLKESEAQLIRSEKMSALGQMVAGLAHETDGPLAQVKQGLATVAARLPQIATAIEQSEKLLLLLRAGKADRAALNLQFAQTSQLLVTLKQQRVLTDLGDRIKDGLRGAGEMIGIVGNLKDFSRLDRDKSTSFNLNDGLASSLGLARHMLRSVHVIRNFGEIPAIVCVPSQINLAFLNLIANAVQALQSETGEITLTTRAEGGGVAVELADNGRSVPPEALSKIFDPYSAGNEIAKGTGLGLFIAYKIVEQHGGRIDATSEVAKGTRFTLWLPATPPAEAAPAA